MNCQNCRFYCDEQSVPPNANRITLVAKCSLFNIQVLNGYVDECTGKMRKDFHAKPNQTTVEEPDSSISQSN